MSHWEEEYEFEKTTSNLEDNFIDEIDEPFWWYDNSAEDNIEYRPALIFHHEGEVFFEWWYMIEDGLVEIDWTYCIEWWAYKRKEEIENYFISLIDGEASN